MVHTVCDFCVWKRGKQDMYFYLLILRWKDKSILSHLVSFGNFQKPDVEEWEGTNYFLLNRPKHRVLWWCLYLCVKRVGKALCLFPFSTSHPPSAGLRSYKMWCFCPWLISFGDTAKERAPEIVALEWRSAGESPTVGDASFVGASYTVLSKGVFSFQPVGHSTYLCFRLI